MKYNKLYFDVDGTLLDFDRAEETAFFKTLAKHGISGTEDMYRIYSSINSRLWKQFERKEILKCDIIETRYREAFEKYGLEYDRSFGIEEDYQEFLSQCSFVIDGTVPVLEKLYKKCDMYIITNGLYLTQKRRIGASGIGKYFKAIFISEQIGIAKPEKKFFDIVFNETDVQDKSKVLIIGDSYTSDITGGFNAGVDTCWINPKHNVKTSERNPDYEIPKLFDLIDIVE